MIRPAALALVLLLPATAAAQAPWRSSYFPYPIGNPTDGPMLVARWQRTQNAPYFLSKGDESDVVNPITFAGAVSVEAGIGTLGSRFGRVEARLPGLLDGWRFRVLLGAERTGKLGYYGLGGDIERAAGQDDRNSDFYRVHRTRYLAQADVTRRITGNLRFALGAFLDRTELTRVADASQFVADFGGSVSRTNLILRPALVFDSRDHEFTPSKGVLAEAGIGVGTARDNPIGQSGKSLYAMGYAQVKGYLSPREGTVIAGRAAFRLMEDAAPLSARFTVPGWEREFSLSGPDGHRSFPQGSLAGTDLELVSLEVRHDLLNAGDLGALTVVAFSDLAHVADNAAFFKQSTDLFGAGGGVALRILRSAILTLDFAGGKNGFNFSMGTNWAF